MPVLKLINEATWGKADYLSRPVACREGFIKLPEVAGKERKAA
jgi:hypothetical protein